MRLTGAMTRRRTPPLALALAGLSGLVGLALAGCSGEQVVRVDAASTSVVELAVGETLALDLGEVNPSVGDAWEVAVEPDPAVLAPAEYHTDGGDGEVAGGSIEAEYRFEAVGPGTTTLELQYAYRGSTDPDETARRVADDRLVVTVTVG